MYRFQSSSHIFKVIGYKNMPVHTYPSSVETVAAIPWAQHGPHDFVDRQTERRTDTLIPIRHPQYMYLCVPKNGQGYLERKESNLIRIIYLNYDNAKPMRIANQFTRLYANACPPNPPNLIRSL